jgi:hypothetical protein
MDKNTEDKTDTFPGFDVLMRQLLVDDIRSMMCIPFAGLITITGKVKNTMNGLIGYLNNYFIAGTVYDLDSQYEKASDESFFAGPVGNEKT